MAGLGVTALGFTLPQRSSGRAPHPTPRSSPTYVRRPAPSPTPGAPPPPARPSSTPLRRCPSSTPLPAPSRSVPRLCLFWFPAPVRLLSAARSAPIRYDTACKLLMPAPLQGCHVLVGEGDQSVFLVSTCALGAATAVSLVCVRANGAVTAGAAQFKCKL
jgi:hypothetical protein